MVLLLKGSADSTVFSNSPKVNGKQHCGRERNRDAVQNVKPVERFFADEARAKDDRAQAVAITAGAKVAGGAGTHETPLMPVVMPSFVLELGTQVALVAADTPVFVQVSVRPVRCWPGLTSVGMFASTGVMTAAVAVTVSVAVSQVV